jgi:hypothetical protein
VSRTTYWVRYRAEDESGIYRVIIAEADTLMALAAQINDILDHGWEVLAMGATSPRELDDKEQQVVEALTHGRLEIS